MPTAIVALQPTADRLRDHAARCLTGMPTAPVALRRCPLTDFGRNAGARNGRTTYCRQCHNAVTREQVERLHGYATTTSSGATA